MAISNPSAIRKKNIEERTPLITALPTYRCDMFLRPPTGAGVIRQDHFQRHRVARSQCREARLDHARDTRVGDLAGEKGLHRDLIERIEQRGRRAAARVCLIGETQTGEAREVGPGKLQGGDPQQIEAGHANAWAMGVRMSGLPSCARREPSTYSTMVWFLFCWCFFFCSCVVLFLFCLFAS